MHLLSSWKLFPFHTLCSKKFKTIERYMLVLKVLHLEGSFFLANRILIDLMLKTNVEANSMNFTFLENWTTL
jgi:hypothetical protein